jgi:hypothetical protein
MKVSAGLKRAIWSSVLAVPVAAVATAVSDSDAVSDAFRYIFSPGTMLAMQVIRVEPTHRGLGTFIDVLHAYAKAMAFAHWVNTIFYGLLFFGVMTTIAGLKEKRDS